MIRFCFVSILGACLSALSTVAQSENPPLEAYGAMPLISSAEMSPDGTKIATIVNAENGSRLVIFSAAGEIIKQVGIAEHLPIE